MSRNKLSAIVLTAAVATSFVSGAAIYSSAAAEPANKMPPPKQMPMEPGFHGMGDKFPGCGMFGHMPPPPPQNPRHLASLLSEAETEIGIRSEQLDAWRDFTDALLAVTTPPHPDRKELPPVPGDQPKAFAFAEKLADDAVARAGNAEALKKAIEALRTKLTPEQLTKVSAIEQRIVALPHDGPMPPPFGPRLPPPPDMGDGDGPRGPHPDSL